MGLIICWHVSLLPGQIPGRGYLPGRAVPPAMPKERPRHGPMHQGWASPGLLVSGACRAKIPCFGPRAAWPSIITVPDLPLLFPRWLGYGTSHIATLRQCQRTRRVAVYARQLRTMKQQITKLYRHNRRHCHGHMAGDPKALVRSRAVSHLMF